MSKKRLEMLIEVFSLIIYFIIIILSIFPQIVEFINDYISISNVVILILCILVYGLLAICLMLYHQIENLRVDITRLTQELAFNSYEDKKRNEKKRTKKN